MVGIREQDPLKQGLKQFCQYCSLELVKPIREQDPLKQGLKHRASSWKAHDRSRIREQDPLKQGLKHTAFGHTFSENSIREQCFLSKLCIYYSRARSNKKEKD